MTRVLVVADGADQRVVMNEVVEPEQVQTSDADSPLMERLASGVEQAAKVEKRFEKMVVPRRLPKKAAVRSYLDIAG
jgi:CheY-like chemotaxis protein